MPDLLRKLVAGDRFTYDTTNGKWVSPVLGAVVKFERPDATGDCWRLVELVSYQLAG